MTYPIVAYGDAILRKKAQTIEKGTALQEVVNDMLTTMDLANGVGLAAPQIGKSIRLFVVDLTQCFEKKEAREEACIKVLINPVITIDETTTPSIHEEGCLSIPEFRADIKRSKKIGLIQKNTDIEGR